MKIILTKPVKIRARWYKAGTEVEVPEEEAHRLGKKGACVLPFEPTEKAIDEATVLFTDPLEATKDAITCEELTSSGAPTVEALEKRLGRNVTAEERNAWFQKVKG